MNRYPFPIQWLMYRLMGFHLSPRQVRLIASVKTLRTPLFDPCAIPSYRRLLDQRFTPSVVEAARNAGSEFHLIQDGAGDYHFDSYEVTLRLPDTVQPETVLREMMANLNHALDSAEFDRLTQMQPRRASGELQPGDIYDIELLGPDHATVILTDAGEDYFVVTTITNPAETIKGHPTPGTREWGFERGGDGVTFYTRGASRTRDPLVKTANALLGLQKLSWSLMIDGLAKMLVRRGGVLVRKPKAVEYAMSERPLCIVTTDAVEANRM